MEKQFALLQHIENNEKITKENHYSFLYHLQSALLLALREYGMFTAMQHRHAEERLKQQRLERAKKFLK